MLANPFQPSESLLTLHCHGSPTKLSPTPQKKPPIELPQPEYQDRPLGSLPETGLLTS